MGWAWLLTRDSVIAAGRAGGDSAAGPGAGTHGLRGTGATAGGPQHGTKGATAAPAASAGTPAAHPAELSAALHPGQAPLHGHSHPSPLPHPGSETPGAPLPRSAQ